MDLLEKFFNIVLSEYGVFVAFLLGSIGVLVYALRTVWNRLQLLTDKLVLLIENNTKVLTRLVDKIEEHDNDE